MGRALAFDREQVLSQVTELFWLKGFQATSVADLAQQTRLKPGSLYNTFESKQGMLLEALERYGRQRLQWLNRVLGQHRTLEQVVEQLLLELVDQIGDDPDAKGCFLLNIKLELSASDPLVADRLESIYGQMERVLLEAITRAVKRQELKPDTDSPMLAKYLLMSMWGLRLLGRSRPGRPVLEAMVAQVLIPVQQARLAVP